MREKVAIPQEREQYQIEEDYWKVKNFFQQKVEIETIFKDKDRLKDLQEFAKKKQDVRKKTNEAIAKGDFAEALGI